MDGGGRVMGDGAMAERWDRDFWQKIIYNESDFSERFLESFKTTTPLTPLWQRGMGGFETHFLSNP
jgi:hypothetical protein